MGRDVPGVLFSGCVKEVVEAQLMIMIETRCRHLNMQTEKRFVQHTHTQRTRTWQSFSVGMVPRVMPGRRPGVLSLSLVISGNPLLVWIGLTLFLPTEPARGIGVFG